MSDSSRDGRRNRRLAVKAEWRVDEIHRPDREI
jgi:hypothetical protein